MIEATGLTKDYGWHRAVSGVSFRIERGDIVGLLGPNGSGKTTIIRMLTGFFAPTAGRCRIAGIDVSAEPRRARAAIGYLPERVALYPDMTVRRYLAFVARVHELKGPTARHVERAIEHCGLTEMAGCQIGKLSRGYRQRVGIAQAVVHDPEVLILDEPTVGLDPRQIVEIRGLIKGLAGRTTVLLSTHILPEVSITCRRVLILDRGRLIAEDTAEGLAARSVGRGEVTVRLRAPEEEALRVLGGASGVQDLRVDRRETDGSLRLAVTTNGDPGCADRLARVVVDRGWALYELAPRAVSLEDLFVQILERASEKGQ